MAEIERLANHFGDIGAICNDAAFALMHAHCAMLRERVLRAAHSCFGHRLMRDRIVPGGVTADLRGTVRAPSGIDGSHQGDFPRARSSCTITPPPCRTAPSLPACSRPSWPGSTVAGVSWAAASGRNFDVRRALPYAPYEGPVIRVGGPLRGRRRCARVGPDQRGERERLADRADTRSPASGLQTSVAQMRLRPNVLLEGAAVVEGFRGDVFVWLRLNPRGRIDRCHLRDPSWFQWPVLEAAIEGNIVADFPLCNKSFNCSYSGHDL